MERLALLLGGEEKAPPGPAVRVVYRGEAAQEEALRARRELLRLGARAEIDYEGRSFKAQMRAADREGARFALILGEDEISRGTATLKDLSAGSQETIPRDEAIRLVLRSALAGTKDDQRPAS
jgi:histidyl-tRNA synthetase